MQAKEPDIPKPVETGSDGTQQAHVARLGTVEPESPFSGLPIARVVEGLAMTRARSMGGEVAAGLIAGTMTQLSYSYQETKNELHTANDKLDKIREDLSACKTRAAVLEERVLAHSRSRHLKNISIATGTALIGIGIQLFRNNFDKFSVMVGGLGVLLLFLGWFSREGGTEK